MFSVTIGRRERAENQRVAFVLMLSALGDDAIDTTLFDSEASPFAESVQRTTWEDLVRAHYVSRIVATTYRLTAKGWLAALKLSGAAESSSYLERVSRVLAAMKAHVKGRRDSKVVDLRTHIGRIFAASGIRVGSERVRVEVEPSQMEVDGVAEPLAVAIPAGLPLDPLDLGVDAL